MNSIYVCFNLKSVPNCSESIDVFDKSYQTVYKPLARFLFSHQNFPISITFNGPQIIYYKKKRNEFITILKQLIERNQIEIIGGGFYDPVFPLLFPVDRNTQIDLLSTEIRQTFTKRPRGIATFGDIWDASLVNNLQTCGIEYTFVDGYNLQEEYKQFLPLLMTDLGKSTEIYPYYNEFIPNAETSVENFIKNIIKNVEKQEKNYKYYQYTPEKIVNINLTHEQIEPLLNTKWFDKLDKYLQKNPQTRIKLSTIDSFRQINTIKIQSYIPCSINKHMYDLINNTKNRNKLISQKSVFDFIKYYKNDFKLYNRMTYLTILVNQYKNDKMRKKASREKLLEAQNGIGILFNKNGPYTNSKYRQLAFKHLNEAEKILREDGKFLETLSRFDYTNDGYNEYVCRMTNYFAYISLLSGSIQEFDIYKCCVNYADNYNRIQEYDGINDDYERGLFVDHLFSNEQFEHYIDGENTGTGIFSKIFYSELKFSQKHHELQLYAEAEFSQTHQKISLRKKYIINSDGMNIQYIIKNLSNKRFKAKFAVECNFANVSFNQDYNNFNLDVVEKEQLYNIDTKKSTKQINKKGKLQNVDVVRLSDTENGISFNFEPNENCGYFYMPISFKRPDFSNNKLTKVSETSVSTLFWDIDIDSEKETEKNINFSITSVKKEKKN